MQSWHTSWHQELGCQERISYTSSGLTSCWPWVTIPQPPRLLRTRHKVFYGRRRPSSGSSNSLRHKAHCLSFSNISVCYSTKASSISTRPWSWRDPFCNKTGSTSSKSSRSCSRATNLSGSWCIAKSHCGNGGSRAI